MAELSTEYQIAVIGMAGRFPGASDLAAYWSLLHEARCGITTFAPEVLQDAVGRRAFEEHWVCAQGLVDEVDQFDAALFGLSAREAQLTDPQQRLFLQVAWTAFEDAGVDPSGTPTGVFAGCDANHYRELAAADPSLREVGTYAGRIGVDPDFLATRLSYLLDLRGPSVPVQTACSTSLVAVHMACQSLLSGECTMALAGGAALPAPYPTGYAYEAEGPLSPDGHCRAFDEAASGVVPGGGVGAVVLRRLDHALAAGDRIYAVIRGSAVNNDGGEKTGFTAPSVIGQRQVIREAMEMAECEPGEIGYVETHGTGTTLGDVVEIEALRQTFEGVDQGSCALGAVKTNIGHANAAAGVAGLIKAVLSMHHRTLTPTLFFNKPNPRLRLPESPFFVNVETRPWTDKLMAGVSSFGIGGSNAHVVLGPAPAAVTTTSEPEGGPVLTVVSAATEAALKAQRQQIEATLQSVAPSEAEQTLNRERRPLLWRQALVWRGQSVQAGPAVRSGRRKLVLLYPGQGVRYEDFGAALYSEEPVFKQTMDACAQHLRSHLGEDPRPVWFANNAELKAKREQPVFFQTAVVCCELAITAVLRARGLEPDALLGHSLGEYACAIVAGVLSLADGMALVAARAAAVTDLDDGAMATVIAEPERITSSLDDGVQVAVIMGPRLCVIAGPREAVKSTRRNLKQEGVATMDLEGSFAFHTPQMERALAGLASVLKTLPQRSPEPEIPYFSNLSGDWQRSVDRDYWGRHLTQPVQLGRSLATLAADPDMVVCEVGPAANLAAVAARHIDSDRVLRLTGLSPHETLALIGDIWANGVSLDWSQYYGERARRHCALPTYPFQTQRYWPSGDQADPVTAGDVKMPLDRWCYLASWKMAPLWFAQSPEELLAKHCNWLLLEDPFGFCERLGEGLRARGQSVVLVRRGDVFTCIDEEHYLLPPGSEEAVDALFHDLSDRMPDYVVHGLRLDESGYGPSEEDDDDVARALDEGYRSLMLIARRLRDRKVGITVLTNGLQRIGGEVRPAPDKGTLLGATWVIPKEFPKLSCRLIDIEPDALTPDAMIAELFADDPVVAYRDHNRWLPVYDSIQLPDEPPPLRVGGTYMITHGFQNLGLALAKRLAEDYRATVIFLESSFFPPRSEWDAWLAQGDDLIAQRILQIRQIEVAGGSVEVVRSRLEDGDLAALVPVVNGIFHLNRPVPAGLIQSKSAKDLGVAVTQKMREVNALVEAYEDIDFMILFAENQGEVGVGGSEQAAIYAFLARFAAMQDRLKNYAVKTIEWCVRDWDEPGDRLDELAPPIRQALAEKRRLFGMKLDDCLTVLLRLLSIRAPQILVSTRDWRSVLADQDQFNLDTLSEVADRGVEGPHPRPELSTSYREPTSEVELLLAELWSEIFGVKPVGLDDDFFELGGHSLIAVQLLERVNRALAVDLSMQVLFDSPSIGGLAAVLASSDDRDDDEEAALIESLLADIEGLSPEEARAALVREQSS